MTVTVYSTTTCPYCSMLKSYLKEKNIEFSEKFVDLDDSVKEEMSAVSGGFLGVPFTIVVKDDGTKEGIIGFDKGRVDSILGLN